MSWRLVRIAHPRPSFPRIEAGPARIAVYDVPGLQFSGQVPTGLPNGTFVAATAAAVT